MCSISIGRSVRFFAPWLLSLGAYVAPWHTRTMPSDTVKCRPLYFQLPSSLRGLKIIVLTVSRLCPANFPNGQSKVTLVTLGIEHSEHNGRRATSAHVQAYYSYPGMGLTKLGQAVAGCYSRRKCALATVLIHFRAQLRTPWTVQDYWSVQGFSLAVYVLL
jgi:hypothetical protein